MMFELRPPAGPEDWAAYHDIRKHILFDARGAGDAYDAAHPDESKPGNHPLLFKIGGKAVGVVRIDLDPPNARLRRMAVDTPYQRQGHGRRMIEEIVSFCGEAGMHRILSAVAPDAVGFYEKCGFETLSEPDDGAVSMQRILVRG
jgi:GNAT superfamily N-acetyltransferase